jgi:hypothetical protein
MDQQDNASPASIAIAQSLITAIGGVAGTLALRWLWIWFRLRGKNADAAVAERQAKLSQEQRILETAVEERKETVRDLRDYIERLERRMDKYELERETGEVKMARIRAERDDAVHQKNNAEMVLHARMETIRLQAIELARYHDMRERIERLEAQVRELGGKPINGH